MRSKIIDILIGLLVGGLMTSLYLLSEDYLFLKLSISATNNTPRYIMRLLLGTPTAVIVVLISWIGFLKSKNRKLEHDIAGRLLEAQKESAELQPKKPEPFFHANLLWLPNDNNPYCPSCYGKDKKLVPMVTYDYHASETQTIKRFRCATSPACKFHTDIVPPPKPTEPASASSAPGPDDYHEPRRSFFHGNRPKKHDSNQPV